MRSLISIMKAPWWLFIVAAAAIFAFGEFVFYSLEQQNAEKRQALSQPAPVPVVLQEFDLVQNRGVADEVHVIGRIDWGNTFQLLDMDNGEVKDERAAYFLMGTQEADNEILAVLLLEEADEELFFSNERDYVTLIDGNEFHQFNGIGKSRHSFAALAKDAMQDYNLSHADDLLFISPFFNGREAGLAPRSDTHLVRWIIHGAGSLILLIGVVQFLLGRRKRAKIEPSAPNISTRLTVADAKSLATDSFRRKSSKPAKQTQPATPLPQKILVGVASVIALSIVVLPQWVWITFPLAIAIWALSYFGKDLIQATGSDTTAYAKKKRLAEDPFDRLQH